ncbi:MAG: M50 family metallopeptidase [Phycisphaerales bacterium]|nr:M50 family metallopeptidase [Phycisphaerales bacterium]
MGFFQQGIPLGRWFGITVVIHWTFLIFAAWRLMGSEGPVMGHAIFMVLLFGVVLLHEFGHALSCKLVGGDAHHIVLWPLGGIAFVQPPMNPWAWLITTACGPLVNAILWPIFWVALHFLPLLEPHLSPMTYAILDFICVEMIWINSMLLLFNLIPGYPMDGGRILQEILWLVVGYQKSLQVAGMIGTVVGGAFIAVGLGLIEGGI